DYYCQVDDSSAKMVF
nr:immunoglobulin light chain junction region [Macaca mulatta]